MIRLALTKGRIEKKAIELLAASNYDVSELLDKGRRLTFNCASLDGGEDLTVILSKSEDVITYVERGACDIGFVGRDTIMEMGGDFYEVLDLNFGKCKFALAGIKGKDFYKGHNHKTIATKYPNVTRKYFAGLGMDCEIVKIHGSVELAPLLNIADAIVDIVETGKTLYENGLEVYTEIAPISARCIVNSASIKLNNQEIHTIINKLKSVI